MERLCGRCGSLVSGNVKFCPMCGEFLTGAVDLGKEDVMPPVQQQQQNYEVQQNYGYSAPQYGNNNNLIRNTRQNQTMTTGQWVGTIILCTMLGIISMILNIIWGFGSDTPEPKRSFCRAMLIMNIVGYVLVIFVGILFAGIFSEALKDIVLSGGF